jgi:hypothetical protein
MAQGQTDAQLIERLERLERNVERLARQLAVELERPAADVDPDIVAMAQHDRMRAAMVYADRTGVDFVSAQRIVNRL